MKSESRPCDLEGLRGLLDESAGEPQRSELVRHLDECEPCRLALERLAAGGQWWEEARRFVGRAGETGECAQPESALGVGTPPRPDRFHKEDEAASRDEENLEFLGTSGMPGSIGRVGPYEITGVLGRGGMGIVLRAHDPALDRPVAIKVLAPRLSTGALARRRFAREARAAAAVVHEHVVAIHAVDEWEGSPYLVMQYVSGKSLQERIDRGGPLRTEEILRIGMQAASGLAAAHAQGLVHRDVKPANILLENGVERVRLTDFGLARAIDDSSLTHSGVVAGTPQYMAPEQARGEPVDHRADLFSLGSVLYAMCAGRPPFRADSTPAVLRRICDENPKPVRQVNPEVPDWLAAVIERLHAKAPSDRYQSASEVAAILGGFLARLQEPARATIEHPDADGPKAVLPFPARPTTTAIFVLLLAVLGAGAGVGLTLLVRMAGTAAGHENSGQASESAPALPRTAPASTLLEAMAPDGPARSVSGVVRDAKTGKAVAKVRMTLPRTTAEATTDADGRYTLHGHANSHEPDRSPVATFDVLVEPRTGSYFAANVQVEGRDGHDPIRADVDLFTGIPFRIRLTDHATGGPVSQARVVYRPLHPNLHVEEALPRGGSGLHCRAAEGRDGWYEGVMLPGPGAICVESFTDHYGPISLDPVAFFVPGTTARKGVDAATVYGTKQLLAVEMGAGRGTHFLPQDLMSGVRFIEPKPGDKPHELHLTLRDNHALRSAP